MKDGEFEKMMHSLKLVRDLREARTIDTDEISNVLAFKLSHHFDPEGDIKEDLDSLVEGIDEHNAKVFKETFGESCTLEDFNKVLESNLVLKEVLVSAQSARKSIEKLKAYVEDNYIDDEAKEFAAICIGTFTDVNSMLLEQDVVPLIKRGVYSEDLASAIMVWKTSADDKATDENFWQLELAARKGILERLIGGHALFLQREMHVGNVNVLGRGDRRSDFALVDGLNRNISLVEIKAPKSKLLGALYRNTYPLSGELSGAISQVISQRNDLVMNFYSKRYAAQESFEVFSPKCFIIAGNLGDFQGDVEKLKAFEIQRQAVAAHVSIVTFDELYHQFSTFNQV